MELAYKRKQRLRGKNRKLRIEQVCTASNLYNADAEARHGKNQHKGVRIFDRNRDGNLSRLSDAIRKHTYHTSAGTDCQQKCPCGKVRTLHKLPYYPDHIAHHALMRVIMPTMDRYYYYDSSASIRGRGIHYAARRVARYIDEHRHAGRLYFVKIDFVKFYHNISQQKCLDLMNRHFSNRGIRYLLREVITACPEGLGIGLYPIQPIANFYLCPMLREVKAHYDTHVFAYCDDIVVIGEDKREVWRAVNHILDYTSHILEQPIHSNIGMQIIDEQHSLDFVGYRFFFGHTLLRTRMKRKFCREMHRLKDPTRRYQVATSYRGWLMHSNGMNLWQTVMNMKSYSELELPDFNRKDKDGNDILDGSKISARMIEGSQVIFHDISIFQSHIHNGKRSAWVQVEQGGRLFKFTTANQHLIDKILYTKEHGMMPFQGTLYNTGASSMPDYDIK